MSEQAGVLVCGFVFVAIVGTAAVVLDSMVLAVVFAAAVGVLALAFAWSVT